MNDRIKDVQVTLTEEEQLYVKDQYAKGVTNPASLVALLYSQGNQMGYTVLKAMVQKLLGIVDIFKSISQSTAELNAKDIKEEF